MYSVNDVGNICLITMLLFVFIAILGAPGAWSMVGSLAFIVFVAVMLHK